MKYLIKKLFEYKEYEEDMTSLFEILLANSKGVDITENKLEMGTYRGKQVVNMVRTLMKNQK